MNKLYLEVPVFSQSSADSVISAGHGTSRLELNAQGSYSQGGTTPSPNTYRHAAVVNSQTPLRVMIRPRGPPDDGSPDFVYSKAELADMVRAVRDWQSSGIMDEKRGDGFVFGVLKPKAVGSSGDDSRAMVMDVDENRHLVNTAAPYPCVFHRAFDDILGSAGATVEEALLDLAACGFAGLLTSGGPGRANDNVHTVARIVRAAPQSLQEVIIGGGVRSSNVLELAEALVPHGRTSLVVATPRVWFHSSCLTGAAACAGEEVDEEELRSIAERVKAIYNAH